MKQTDEEVRSICKDMTACLPRDPAEAIQISAINYACLVKAGGLSADDAIMLVRWAIENLNACMAVKQ